MTRRIIIKDGQICGFADEVNIDGVTIEQTEKTRVSHIVPKNWFLRVAFLVLRGAVRDESRAAEWTRNWQCLWLVKIEKETFGPFCDRQKAIEFEKNGYTDLMVDGAPLPHQPDTIIRWLIDRPRS